MKVRESGMPEEAYWETLFNVPLILDRLAVDVRLRNVVEFGCGYGTFTIPVAKRISGTLTTFDMDATMVDRTRQRATAAGAQNVVVVVRDVFAGGFGIEPESQDACLLFNILHCEEPLRLLTEGSRVVRPGGTVLVIHWRYDPATPRAQAWTSGPDRSGSWNGGANGLARARGPDAQFTAMALWFSAEPAGATPSSVRAILTETSSLLSVGLQSGTETVGDCSKPCSVASHSPF